MGPPRAKLDERSRTAKAQKIATLSGIVRPPPGAAMLYFGSGSDYIAAYFSRLGFGESGTFAVGIVDTERVSSGYQFTEISGTELPFADGRFDFHIQPRHQAFCGSRAAHAFGRDRSLPARQWRALYCRSEPLGLIDAHHRLPLLGWLPRQLAHLYLRLTRKADSYDWYPLSRRDILRLLRQQGFQAEDVTLEAIRLAGETGLLRLVSGLPDWSLRLLRPVVPTLFFVCTKGESGVRKPIGQIGGD
jgi:hypothetical protein